MSVLEAAQWAVGENGPNPKGLTKGCILKAQGVITKAFDPAWGICPV
jgi:hypothetical protein